MLKEYIKNHGEEIVTLPINDIIFTYNVHNKGTVTPTDKPSEDLVIVVKRLPKENYTLVVGWNDYMIAKERGLENIKCIVTEDTRTNFLRNNVNNIPVCRIRIPKSFCCSKVNPEKIEQRIKDYQRDGKFNTEICIKTDRMLVDGYATYLAAKQLGLGNVPVRCI